MFYFNIIFGPLVAETLDQNITAFLCETMEN